MEKKKLIIIDANAVIHRAFHALPPLSTKKGELVNAIYGFLLVFLKAVKEFKRFTGNIPAHMARKRRPGYVPTYKMGDIWFDIE